jgi:predicted RNase H-like HicB family nuclease
MKIKHYTRSGKLGKEIYVLDEKQGGYTAFFLEFSNIVTQGETIKEAQTNLWNTLFDVLKNFLNK